MPLLFWDASALAKRYALEIGSEAVDAIFASVSIPSMRTTTWGYAETYSILLRKYNGGRLDLTAFTTSVTALQNEVIDDPDFGLVTVDDVAVLAGIPLMRRHNVNSADAAILAGALHYADAQPGGRSTLVLVACDQRLVRAAAAERLQTLNPERLAAIDIAGFIASL